MPSHKSLEHKHLRVWENVAEAIWKRYPGAVRFPERVDVAVTSKRIALDQSDAVIERRITYDYSEKVPLILRANVNPADRFVMLETLTFNWRERTLQVEVHNETGLPDVSYRELTMIAAHPDNELWTMVRQTGSYESNLFFGINQMGCSMCEEIYNLNFMHNVDADVSLMQEFASTSSSEVVGYFPTYLRQLFIQDYDPSQLPPLPPPTDGGLSRSDVGGGGAMAPASTAGAAAPVGKEVLDPEETARRLAWMFSPTPPIAMPTSDAARPKAVEVPRRLGRKGAALTCMKPTLVPMHTFHKGAPTGPDPPPLEIYGVMRDGAAGDSIRQRDGQGASSLVMF
mmetsp:Transcript_43844/g.104205  ORF Transcript_43844/g.104205 Transcript_43844/m.104205 type:complete len:341 (+) Transcript_43844:73-1095(+)